MSQPSYSNIPQPGSPTQTEAWALTESARRIMVAMVDAQKSGDLEKPAANKLLREALRLNWRLWTIFQAELTLENSPVPEDIRQNVLTLAQFVDKQTPQCLAELKSSDIEGLININRNLAQGLLEGLSQNQPAPEPGQPLNLNGSV